MWRAHSRRKTSPKELLASDFESLEVARAPGGDQESLKEVPKSSNFKTRNEGQEIGGGKGKVSSGGFPIIVRVSGGLIGRLTKYMRMGSYVNVTAIMEEGL